MRRLLVLAMAAALGGPMSVALGGGIVTASAAQGNAHQQSQSSSSAQTTLPSAAEIVATAHRYLHYPYAYIGADPTTGFSCIGLVHYVFARHGIYVPDDVGKAYGSAPHVNLAALMPGDLVFFQNTVWNGISHVALYIGNGQMIAADSFETGVRVDTLSDPYWQEHVIGATRPLVDPSGTPPDPTTGTIIEDPAHSFAPPREPTLVLKNNTTLTARHTATVYSGPGISYAPVDAVDPSAALTVVQTQGQWINVYYNSAGAYGWVAGADVALPVGTYSTSTQTVVVGANGATTLTPRTGINGDTTLTVSTPSTGVYSGPREGYTLLCRLPTGTVVTLRHMQNGWAQVTLLDGTQGWVDGAALGFHRASPHIVAGTTRTATLTTVRSGLVQVRVTMLYVRTTPAFQGRVIRRVHAGDRLRLLNANDAWDYVALRDGSRGWVSARWG